MVIILWVSDKRKMRKDMVENEYPWRFNIIPENLRVKRSENSS